MNRCDWGLRTICTVMVRRRKYLTQGSVLRLLDLATSSVQRQMVLVCQEPGTSIYRSPRCDTGNLTGFLLHGAPTRAVRHLVLGDSAGAMRSLRSGHDPEPVPQSLVHHPVLCQARQMHPTTLPLTMLRVHRLVWDWMGHPGPGSLIVAYAARRSWWKQDTL